MVGVKVFGAHSAGGVLWFACAGEDGFHDMGEDYRVAVPTALESGEALERTQEDLARVLRRHSPDEVWLLLPESNYESKYLEFLPRATVETLLVLACNSEGIPVERKARQTIKGLLGLTGQRGGLATHSAVVGEKFAPHWGPNKRDLAAMVALAAVKELGGG
jgi:hypothetical protein